VHPGFVLVAGNFMLRSLPMVMGRGIVMESGFPMVPGSDASKVSGLSSLA